MKENNLKNKINKTIEINILTFLKNQMIFIIGTFVFIIFKFHFGIEMKLEEISINIHQNIEMYIIAFYVLLKILNWKLYKIKIYNFLLNIIDSIIIIGGLFLIITTCYVQKEFYTFCNGCYITNVDPILYKYDIIISKLINLGIELKDIQKYYTKEVAEIDIQALSYTTLDAYSTKLAETLKEKIEEAAKMQQVLLEEVPKKNWFFNNKKKIIIGTIIVVILLSGFLKGPGSVIESTSSEVVDAEASFSLLEDSSICIKDLTSHISYIKDVLANPQNTLSNVDIKRLDFKVQFLNEIRTFLKNPDYLTYFFQKGSFQRISNFFGDIEKYNTTLLTSQNPLLERKIATVMLTIIQEFEKMI